MKWYVFAIPMAAFGATLGHLSVAHPETSTIPVSREVQPRLPSLTNWQGGEPTSFNLELFPDSISTTGSRSAINYKIELNSNTEKTLGYSMRVKVYDAAGTVVQSLKMPAGQLKPEMQVESPEFGLGQLADGYYALVAEAAGAAPGQRSALYAVQYLTVENGQMYEITAEEWQEAAGNATAAAEGDAP